MTYVRKRKLLCFELGVASVTHLSGGLNGGSSFVTCGADGMIRVVSLRMFSFSLSFVECNVTLLLWVRIKLFRSFRVVRKIFDVHVSNGRLS